jgi:tetraacyldisaccharide 4'-kinase
MNACLSIILPPLSVLYEGIVRTRTAFYQRGLFSMAELDSPVISVGNITTGGTGKTPLVEWLVRKLARDGRKVCVLTRGYGRVNPRQRVIVSDGEAVLANADRAGDEALLLAKNLNGMCRVISDVDRVAAGRWATHRFDVDTFVLDDGFQYLRLRRDLNIATIDATIPWGGSRLLPYGRLREPLSSLRRADCIVLTRAEQVGDTTEIVQLLGRLSGGRPVFRSEMQLRGFSRLANGEINLSGNSPKDPILAFCGVGNPEAFFNELRRQGFVLALTLAFSDHHSYKQHDLDRVIQEAKRLGVRNLITTAKDAVKLTSFDFDIPCHVIDIEIVIEDEARLMEMIRASIVAQGNRMRTDLTST